MTTTQAKKELRSFIKNYKSVINQDDIKSKNDEDANYIINKLILLIETAINKPPKRKK